MIPEDTIVAVSTPAGRGGIGVVRMSGPNAIEIASRLITFPKLPLETQRATLGTFSSATSDGVLDHVVVTCFRAPHSYTTEDVVEISCHGSPVILRHLHECCVDAGARVAEPGEFTMRAFLKGRIDLTQAEAVRDLIESQTLYQARVAARQLEGSVSARLKPHKLMLLELIARLEAGIDFAEDDVSVIDWKEIVSRLDRSIAELQKLVAGFKYGRIVREGLTLAIVGRPNVGKSSLFNKLLNEERAIVTPIPGTTRDTVTETISVGGIPLRFVDTAGIRESQDHIEQMGVKRSFTAIADSDLRLMVVDASGPWTKEDTALLNRLLPLGSLLVAMNKSDLPSRISDVELGISTTDAPSSLNAEVLNALVGDSNSAFRSNTPVDIVHTSAVTGEGISELRDKILALATPKHGTPAEGEMITNLRHWQLIETSLAGLAKARKAAEEKTHHEMLLIDLYDTLRPIDLITGATYADDVLDVIFKTFCVGK
jgi:tRNA modification GTPase